AGSCRIVRSYRPLPCHGHDVLAAPGRGGAGAAGGATMMCDALLAQSYTQNSIAVPKSHDPGPAIVYCDNVNDTYMRRRAVCLERLTAQPQASQKYLIRWHNASPQR